MRALVLAVSIAAGLALGLLGASCGTCPDTDGNQYECNCSASCNGQPVSSFSTPCADDSSEARAEADAACQQELSLCPGVTCSCSCSDTGDDCPLRTCR